MSNRIMRKVSNAALLKAMERVDEVHSKKAGAGKDAEKSTETVTLGQSNDKIDLKGGSSRPRMAREDKIDLRAPGKNGLTEQGPRIDPDQLRDIKVRIDGIEVGVLKDGATRIREELLGPGNGSGRRPGGRVRDQFPGGGGSKGDRLISDPGFKGSRNSQVGTILRLDRENEWPRLHTEDGWVLVPPPGATDDDIQTYVHAHDIGTEPPTEPPDDEWDFEVIDDSGSGGSTRTLTSENARGLAGQINGDSTPNPQDDGLGGPVNGDATPGGQQAQVGQPADGFDVGGATTSITEAQLKAIEALLNGKINEVKI